MPPVTRRATKLALTNSAIRSDNLPTTSTKRQMYQNVSSSSSPRKRPVRKLAPRELHNYGDKNELPITEHSSPLASHSTSNNSNKRYWLLKAEPESRLVKNIDVKFSIDDLAAMTNQTSSWEGVRNYEARNIMRDQMKQGDLALFYHSNCKIPGIVGVVEVVKEGYPDHTACDPNHPYYDAKIKAKDPARWFMVDVKFVKKWPRLVSLKELQTYRPGPLEGMTLLNRGRLSVQSVSSKEFEFISHLANRPPPATEKSFK
ncbi:hypothetical protein IWQ61_002526 [Dispira simplex]|nr:hypothetical protein IWQ61_002526 [Dispira simplex]